MAKNRNMTVRSKGRAPQRAASRTAASPSPVSFTFADRHDVATAKAKGPAKGGFPRPRPGARTSSRTLPSHPPSTLHLLTPTEVHRSPRGDDEVHPLAAGARPAPPPRAPGGEGDLLAQVSDLTSLASSAQHDDAAAAERGAGDGPQGGADGLTPPQQAAMDRFLAAQRGGDPLAKGERWRELVRLMKADEGRGRPDGRAGGGRARRGRGARSRGSARSLSSRDEILGTLKFVRGGSISSARSGMSSLSNSHQYGFGGGSDDNVKGKKNNSNSNSNSNSSSNNNNNNINNHSNSNKSDDNDNSRNGSNGNNRIGSNNNSASGNVNWIVDWGEVTLGDETARGYDRANGSAAREGKGGGGLRLSPRAQPSPPRLEPAPPLTRRTEPPPMLPLTGPPRGAHLRPATPPTAPAGTAESGRHEPPLVSPLSLGSLEDYISDVGAPTVPACGDVFATESTDHAEAAEDREGRGSRRRGSAGGDGTGGNGRARAVFFDIGASFADNSRRAAAAGASRSPTRAGGGDYGSRGGAGVDVRDLNASDEATGTDDGNKEAAAAVSSPSRPSPRLEETSKLTDKNAVTPGWHTLIGQSIDGEVMSFQETEPQALPPPPLQSSSGVLNGQQEMQQQPQEDSQALASKQTTTEKAVAKPPNSLTPRRRVRPRSLRRRQNNSNRVGSGSANIRSLEEQILSVIKLQQKNSDDREDTGKAGEEKELKVGLGHSSPLCAPPTSTDISGNDLDEKHDTQKNGSTIGGTVNAAPSAQDILRELRNSTPCTLHSGGTSGDRRSVNSGGDNSSSLNSNSRKSQPQQNDPSNSNKPPCVSIDIGRQSKQSESQERPQQQQPPAVLQQTQQQDPGQPAAMAPAATADRGARHSSPAPPLAPSRRDLFPRPGYLSRRSSSEPSSSRVPTSLAKSTDTDPSNSVLNQLTPATSTSAAVALPTSGNSTDFATRPNAAAVAPLLPLKLSHVLAKDDSTSEKSASEDGDDISNDAEETTKLLSPLQRYCKTIGISSQKMQNNGSSLRRRTFGSRLFPHTSPAVAGTKNINDNTNAAPRRLTDLQQRKSSRRNLFVQKSNRSTNPFDDSPPRKRALNSYNPFDSPPKTEEDPFEEHLSPIPINDVSVEEQPPQSLEKLVHRWPPAPKSPLAPSRRDTLFRTTSLPLSKKTTPAAAPRPDAIYRSTRNLDEIRASITELKHNGVGGVGKSTSTLVRHEETGRYVIRDMDDEGFHEMINGETEGDLEGLVSPDDLCYKTRIPSNTINEVEYEENSSSNCDARSVPQDDLEGELPPEDDGLCNSHGHPNEINEVGDTKSDNNNSEEKAVPPTDSVARAAQQTPNNVRKNLRLWRQRQQQRSETQQKSPIKFMMANHIMNESVLDDDAVEDAVRAAIDLLSVTSSTTTCATDDTPSAKVVTMAEETVAEESGLEQREGATKESVVALPPLAASLDDNDGADDFFVIQRSSSGGYCSHGQETWNDFHDETKWSAFENSSPISQSSKDVFQHFPPTTMDDWGFGTSSRRVVGDDDDSFAPGPRWDEDNSVEDNTCNRIK